MTDSVRTQFEIMVSAYAERIAVATETKDFTYWELDQRSNQYAQWVSAKKNGRKTVVGIAMNSSFEAVASILGCLKAGVFYAPLDPSYPEDRLKNMIATAKIDTVICENLADLNLTGLFGNNNTCESKSLSSSIAPVEASELGGYIIFTSGSTGKPKGVQMGEEALVNLIEWQNESSECGKTLQFAPLSFDVHFQEIFSTLLAGETLQLCESSKRADFKYLLNLIKQEEVERVFLPFVALNSLCEVAKLTGNYPGQLKTVFTAGEQLRINENVKEFFLRSSACLENQYGPSETHVVTSFKMEKDVESWESLPPIGKPIQGVQYKVLDANGEEALEGELYIGGPCLADGYINDPIRTSERFLELGGERFYRTGDLVCVDPKKNLRFLSRVDEQVKINGHRVELGEIENTIEKLQPGCSAYAALAAGASSVQDHFAYINVFIIGEFSEANLRRALADHLPEYMLPRFIFSIDEAPKTPSGKIDRKKLKAPIVDRPDLDYPYRAPVGEVEVELCMLWSELLHIKRIGVDDDFFALGGNSLLALVLMVECEKRFNKNLSIADIFAFNSIARMAAFLEQPAPVQGASQINSLHEGPKEKRERHDIAIIAMAGRFPGANTMDQFWENLIAGKNSLKEFSQNEIHPSVDQDTIADPNFKRVKGEFDGYECFDHQFFGMPPLEAKLMDPQHRKFLELSYELLENGGVDLDGGELDIGVFAGSAHNTYTENLKFHEDKTNAFGQFNLMLANDKDYLATRVSHKFGLTGPSVSINTGCSTSLVAIAQAVLAIRSGQCRSAIAGGIAISGQKNTGYLHQEGSIYSKTGDCRPYDSLASGTVFSDGAGLVLLKELDCALKDGNEILGVIKGIGLNNDGKDKMSFTAPSVKGQKEAIKMAIRDAGISPDEIEYVEGHGTATPIGDPIEIKALHDAYMELGFKGEHPVSIGSVKSNIGHTTAAAGAIGVIKSVLCLKEKQIPALCGFKKINKSIQSISGLIRPAVKTIPFRKNDSYVAVSSFGVGGTNAHIIIQSANGLAPSQRTQANESKKQNKAELLFLSAKSPRSLELMGKRVDFLAEHDCAHPKLIDQFAAKLAHRREFNLRKFRTLAGDWSKDFKLRMDAKLCFVFPGQGAQYIGMGKELCERFDVFSRAYKECLKLASEVSGQDVERIIGINISTASVLDEERLNNTKYAQIAIFCFEYSLGKLLLSLGAKPDYWIGHSIGEFAIAALNSVFSLQDAIEIVCKRGELMASLPKGAMLSVVCDNEFVKSLLSEDVQIAARNGDESFVISGDVDSIKAIEAKLTEEGVPATILRTSHAFHSQMMRPILAEFKSFISGIEMNPPATPLLSCVSAQFEQKAFSSAEYWAQHIVEPVLFAPSLDALFKHAQDPAQEIIFVEVGPRAGFKNLIKKQALSKDSQAHTISLTLGKKNQEQVAFMQGVGELWARCGGIDPKLLYKKSHNPNDRVSFNYIFQDTKHWLDYPKDKRNLTPAIDNKIYENRKGKEMSHDPKSDEAKVLRDKLGQIFESAAGIELDDYTDTISFLEMGLDSLFLTQISLKVKQELGVAIAFRELSEGCDNIERLMARIMDEAPKQIIKSKEVKVPEQSFRSAAAYGENSVGKNSEEIANGLEKLISSQMSIMEKQLEMMRESLGKNAPKAEDMTKPKVYAPKHDMEEENGKVQNEGTQKVFGAMARISKTKQKQKAPAFIETFIEQYNLKTKNSKAFTQNNRVRHADPRAVSGFCPELKEMVYPIVVDHSKMQRLFDIDGNEYVDMLCGFGSNFFGNGQEKIKNAVKAQLEAGIEIGPQHALTEDVTKLISELTGNERSAFCNTGSEGVLGAMRIARTVTGRNTIIAFSNSYHGINDEVIVRGAKNGKAFPAAPGILGDSVENMRILDYGTDECLVEIERLCASGKVAALLVEPVQSRRCDFHPVEFLLKAREITKRWNVCLIFDEVITGFRIAPGGAQEAFGVDADLCVYGKILGAGMPIGVISGKAEYMDALDGGNWQFGDSSRPEKGVTYFAGTFVRHPLALAAAKAGLEILKEGGHEIYEKLNAKAQTWVNEINNILSAFGAPMSFARFGSLIKPKYKEDEFPYASVLFAAMRFHGLHVYEGFPWFINLAHTDEDLERAKKAIIRSLRLFQENGQLSGVGVQETNENLMRASSPPVPGARLGLDQNGRPAWFKENPERPGSFVQL